MRMKPEPIRGFEHLKFSHVSCGFKHTISKTTLGKVYTWGWGEHGQLGTGEFQSHSTPKHLRLDLGNVIQVQAGMKCSIVLIDNKTIYWAGTNGTISYQGTFCKFKVEAKVLITHQLFHLVSLTCKWQLQPSQINEQFLPLPLHNFRYIRSAQQEMGITALNQEEYAQNPLSQMARIVQYNRSTTHREHR